MKILAISDVPSKALWDYNTREKLEGISDQWSLKTVWGVGYKFELHNG